MVLPLRVMVVAEELAFILDKSPLWFAPGDWAFLNRHLTAKSPPRRGTLLIWRMCNLTLKSACLGRMLKR